MHLGKEKRNRKTTKQKNYRKHRRGGVFPVHRKQKMVGMHKRQDGLVVIAVPSQRGGPDFEPCRLHSRIFLEV